MGNAAAMAAQSDPDRNHHFRRRWGPPAERRSPRTTGIVQGPDFKNDSSTPVDTSSACLLQAAFHLDRKADAELAVGRVSQAERLSHEAAELRAMQA